MKKYAFRFLLVAMILNVVISFTRVPDPSVTEPMMGVVRIPKHYTIPDCTGPVSWTHWESVQVIDADRKSRGTMQGILSYYIFPEPYSLPDSVGDIDFLTGIGGTDPRDGCPYAIELIAGTNLAYVIKKGEGIGGNYDVYLVNLLSTPAHVVDVSWVEDGVIIRYESEGDGEINETIPFAETMAVG